MPRRNPTWTSFYGLPSAHRLDRIFPGFESEERALREDRERIRLMQEAIEEISCRPLSAVSGFDPYEISKLAEQMTISEVTGVHCKSLASSFSMRDLRLSQVGAMLQLFQPYPNTELIAITILNERWVLTPQQLLEASASSIRDELRRHLVRAGLNLVGGPLVLFLHGEFDPVAEVYVLHFHGITLKIKKPALLSMSGHWGYVPTASGAVPIRCDPVADRARQFSYCLKAFWPERDVTVLAGRTERDRKPRRIGEPHASLVMVWLDRQSPSDIRILMGCRVGRGGSFVEHERT
jgi:hypothetical protein